MGGGSDDATVDDSIGSIVWVRRRNGSWWPGRILAANELSLSHLMSPRSGTPVKLLGREDASVDWYNLEKSKRVKAFRCGEFNDCIIKAESCAGAPTKKREKYARREDAILHALELEKQQAERRKGSTCPEVVSSDGKECVTLAEQSKNCDKSQYAPDDCIYSDFLDAENSGVSGQNTITEFSSRQMAIQKVRQENEINRDDDGIEGMPRMRGLQDFGLRIAQTKKKPIIAMVSDVMGKVVPAENCACSASCIASSTENESFIINNKGSLSYKRKRSHVGHTDELLVKRRDRRRPLTQVLQSSEKLPVSCSSDCGCSMHELVQQEGKQRGMHLLAPKHVKNSSFYTLPNNNSNCTGISPKRQMSFQVSQRVCQIKEKPSQSHSLMADNTYGDLPEQQNSISSEKIDLDSVDQEGDTTFTDSQVLSIPISKNFANELDRRHCEDPIQGQTSLINKTELDQANFSSSFSRHKSAEKIKCAVADAGVSKWQLKGKRNARYMNKRKLYSTNERTLVEKDNKCRVVISAKSSEDKLYVNEEPKTETVSGSASVEPEVSPKIERQLGNCFIPECHQIYDSAKSNSMDFADERQQRTGSSPPRKKAELHQTDSKQALWETNSEGFDSETFPRPVCEALKSLDQIQFKQSDSLRIPKFLQLSEPTSTESSLFDVQIDVRASYKGEHVPLVSLMSKFNGKAIIGHPIAVETLEDGYSDIFLAEDGYLNDSVTKFQSYGFDKVKGGALQPVWRTARRTSMQRNRRPSSLLNDNSNSSQYLTHGNRQSLGKVYPGILNHKIRYIRKNMRYSTLDKKLPKRFLKNVDLPSRKTRTLSSITVEHNLTNETNESTHPIKMAEVAPVSCIPIKLIFSRIKEAVGSTSKSGSHRLSHTSLAVEKPK
ncbi:hypothetical protein SUGI_0189980 [Cryptomeria japonica]|nr:hypothetical protein SUGI_0189980 [Cryptomeria japonica]